MEPLTAVSLAGTILQFIDFSSKLVAGTYEVYRSASGATAENEDITTVISDLKEVTSELDVDIPGRGKHEKALKALATKCADLSGQLLAVLEKLKTPGKTSAWKSIRVKWSSMRKSDEIQRIERRLGEYRSEILVRLGVMLSDQQSSTKAQLDQIQNDAKRLSTESAVRLSSIRDDIVKAVEHQMTHLPTAPEKSQTRSVRDTTHTVQPQVGLQEAKGYLDSLISLVATIPLENRILDNIYFTSMHDREDTIHDAEIGTMAWLFLDQQLTLDDADDGKDTYDDELRKKSLKEEQKKRTTARSSFLAWLCMDNGIFHISGKAGSGKSTLMKYLCNHEMTNAELMKWAGDKTLAFARFFFWKAGDDLQKSLQGLYRSLLFEVLRQCPEFIPMVFPSQWERLQASNQCLADKTLFRHHHIVDAFKILIQQTTFPKHRFCFFIDGLDEYDGDTVDHTTLATNLRSWALGEDVKSASARDRIWSSIKCLQALLIGMIKQAIGWTGIQDDYLYLINRVVDRSDGVFLWAWLVVRILMTGILRQDPINTLLATLDTTPKELNDLYTRLLDSLQQHDRKRAAQMLILVACNRHNHPFSSLAFYWLDHLEDPDFPASAKILPFRKKTLRAAIDTTDRQVRSIAKGFLESFPFPNGNHRPQISSLGSAGLLGYRFFHRTARDFVLNHRKLDEIVDTKALSSAETAHRLRLAELMSLDYSVRYHLCKYMIWTIETYFGKELPFTLLERYHRVFQETAGNLFVSPELSHRCVWPASEMILAHHLLKSSFPHLVIGYGCGHYVMQLVENDKRLLEGTSDLNLLVTAALHRDANIVKSLLRAGAPVDSQILVTCNYHFRHESGNSVYYPVWMVILSWITIQTCGLYLQKFTARDEEFEILEALLRHKYIPDCVFMISPDDLPSSSQRYFISLRQMITEMVPNNRDLLLSLFKQRPGTRQAIKEHLRAVLTRSHTKEDRGPELDGRVPLKPSDYPDETWNFLENSEVVCGEWRLSPGFRVGVY
ncbi:hypothetical protein BJX65DRAFT_311748 [Aspergillus insuetus]